MAFMWEAAIGGAVCQEKVVAVPACSAEALCLYGGGAGGEPPDLPVQSSLLQLKPETDSVLGPVLSPKTPMCFRGPEEVT